MDMRNPVRSLTWAVIKALEKDLSGVESKLADELLGAGSAKGLTARPRIEQCSVVLFTQAWTAGEIGFVDRGVRQQHCVETETVVVTGPCGDACVYASTQLLYRIATPNRQFFLDVVSQRMRGRGASHVYEGRDSADLEAFDYEASAAMAKVCGASSMLTVEDARRAARLLTSYVGVLEGIAGKQAIGG